MKKVFLLSLVLLMTFMSCIASADGISSDGIKGSSVDALLSSLKSFGINTPEPRKYGELNVWESRYENVKDVQTHYSIYANNAGEIVSATFSMNVSDNGLFDVVALMDYDLSNKLVTSSFMKSSIDKETNITVGDAKFSLHPETSTSVSSITIGSRTWSEKTTYTTYYLDVEYTEDVSGDIVLVKLNHEAKLREEPNGNSKYHGAAKKGEELAVIMPFYNEDWHQIMYNGEIYFVYADYCEFITQ